VPVICAAVNGDIVVTLRISVGTDVKKDRAMEVLHCPPITTTTTMEETHVIARMANVAANTAIAERPMRTVVLDVKADRAPMAVATLTMATTVTMATTETMAIMETVAIPTLMAGRLSLPGTVLLTVPKARASLDLVELLRLPSTIMELPL